MRTMRRWALRVLDSDGQDVMLVIQVPQGRGVVCASLGKKQIELPPRTVSRLIEAYREAQLIALQERGGW